MSCMCRLAHTVHNNIISFPTSSLPAFQHAILENGHGNEAIKIIVELSCRSYTCKCLYAGINTGLSIAGSSGGGNQTCFSTLVLFSKYTCIRYPREGKSISGVGNPCAPHPQNKSLYVAYIHDRNAKISPSSASIELVRTVTM